MGKAAKNRNSVTLPSQLNDVQAIICATDHSGRARVCKEYWISLRSSNFGKTAWKRDKFVLMQNINCKVATAQSLLLWTEDFTKTLFQQKEVKGTDLGRNKRMNWHWKKNRPKASWTYHPQSIKGKSRQQHCWLYLNVFADLNKCLADGKEISVAKLHLPFDLRELLFY